MLEGLISAAEAAQRVRRTRESVVRAIARGEYRGVNIEGRWFVEVASLPSEAGPGTAGQPVAAAR